MQLKFRNQYREINNPLTSKVVIENINELIGSQYLFSHLDADGAEVYENQEQFLEQNLKDIQMLEVIAYTPSEFIASSLLDAETYLERALKGLDDLSDGFYKTPGTDDWASFSKMLEGIQWINLVIISIEHLEEKPVNWMEFMNISNKLENELKNLEEAIETKDFVLIADLIQYEILSMYELLMNEIKKTLASEGMRNDVN